MRWFRRRRGVDVGTYEAPPRSEPAPVERVVEEGVLIGESVVRMTLRNRVIVDALRDRRDLDRASLAGVAAHELENLADHEWESAERIRFRRNNARIDDPLQEEGLDPDERRESSRREKVHRAMSEAFAARAAEDEALLHLVERARTEAWDEVGPVLLARADAAAHDIVPDARYDQERADRIGALVALDLTGLAFERGVEL